MLWGFNFNKRKGPNGELIEVDTASETGWMTVPKNFACSIKSRSSERAKVIRQAFAEAEARGMEYEFRKK